MLSIGVTPIENYVQTRLFSQTHHTTPMIPKNLKDINIDDLKSLIENSVKEGKTIDYKLAVNISSDSDRKEFLYDVSSFANASGGDIIFGVKENEGTGYPDELVGLEGNMDELRQLLLQRLLSPTYTCYRGRYRKALKQKRMVSS